MYRNFIVLFYSIIIQPLIKAENKWKNAGDAHSQTNVLLSRVGLWHWESREKELEKTQNMPWYVELYVKFLKEFEILEPFCKENITKWM